MFFFFFFYLLPPHASCKLSSLLQATVMKFREERRANSVRTLQLLLGPIVYKKKRQNQRRKALQSALKKCDCPSNGPLKSVPLIAKWPIPIVKRLFRSARLAHFESGSVIALNGEPLATAEVIFLVSGKVTQLPTKAEIFSCYQNLQRVDSSPIGASTSSKFREPLTGPFMFPQLFSDIPKATSISVLQEIVLGRLETYSAGQVVDSNRLVLQTGRIRSLRCLSAVVAYMVPLKSFCKELTSLPKEIRNATYSVAKSNMQNELVRYEEKVTLDSILVHNPILSKIGTFSLQQVFSQLIPTVFMPGDVISPNIYVSDFIFFLHRGKVILSRKKEKVKELCARGSSIGLNSFVSFMIPKGFNEVCSAVARTYCEVWGISFQKLIQFWKDDRVSCIPAASKGLQGSMEKIADQLNIVGKIGRVPALSCVSEICLHKIASTMKVYIHGPGQCIARSNRLTKVGILLVVGRAQLVKVEKNKKVEEPAVCGLPYFFCEAINGRVLNTSLCTETSVIALHCSTSAILDAVEEVGGTTKDVDMMYELAAKYITETYGAAEPRIEAQMRAAARVREFNQLALPPPVRPSSAAVAEALQEERLKLENEVVTSIVVRLQALHQDPLMILRHNYLTRLDDVSIKEEQTSGRKRFCYTINDNGDLFEEEIKMPLEAPELPSTYSTNGSILRSTSLDIPHSTNMTPPLIPAVSETLSPPRTCPSQREEGHTLNTSRSGLTARQPLVDVLSHFDNAKDRRILGSNKYLAPAQLSSSPQGVDGLMPQSLAVAFQSAKPVNATERKLPFFDKSKSKKRSLRRYAPPHLAAIQDHVEQLQNEALGLNVGAEYRKHLLRNPQVRR